MAGSTSANACRSLKVSIGTNYIYEGKQYARHFLIGSAFRPVNSMSPKFKSNLILIHQLADCCGIIKNVIGFFGFFSKINFQEKDLLKISFLKEVTRELT